MNFGEHVFHYCERGADAALWAEPINAISNAGFFLAALIFWQCLLWRTPQDRNADHYLLIALVFLVGFGSLAFHLYADEGTALADVIPIGLFMLVYLGIALNRFLGVLPGWTVFLVVGFAALMAAAAQVHCWDGGIGLRGAVEGSKPCLNGSMAYLPALAAMIVIGMVAAERHHKAAPYILWAAVLFTLSLLLRSLDFAFCDQVVIDGRKVGTHFIWHLLNAVVIFLLLRATLETGFKEAPAAESEPMPVAPPVEAVPTTKEPKESPEIASAGEEAAIEAAKPKPEPEAESKPMQEHEEPEPVPPEPKEAEPEKPAVEEGRPDDTSKEPADDAETADEPEDDAPSLKRRSRRKKPTFPA
jgi:Ceramidase